MAVKVTPARSMNTVSSKTYEAATKFKVVDHDLVIYQGNKLIAQHAAGSWESVEVLELLDAPKFGTPTKGVGKKSSPKKAGGRARVTPKTKSREGAEYRTSPARGRHGIPGVGVGY